MEDKCDFISSTGFLFGCDHHDPQPQAELHWCRGIDFSSIRRGQVLHVPTAAVWHVFQNINNIPEPFVLVTGFSDTNIPNGTFWPNDAAFFRDVEHSKLIHWFSQNLMRSHPKLTHLPIGIEYHSVNAREHGMYGIPHATPVEQENALKNIKKNAKPFWERDMRVYINLFHDRCDDRRQAMQTVTSPEVCYRETKEINRHDTWKNQINFAFVLSPFGNGMDCHRTWESLILGGIPIIHKSGIDPLFDELPVWLVDDWNDVNDEDKRKAVIEKFKNMTFNYDKLKREYWVELFHRFKPVSF